MVYLLFEPWVICNLSPHTIFELKIYSYFYDLVPGPKLSSNLAKLLVQNSIHLYDNSVNIFNIYMLDLRKRDLETVFFDTIEN